MAIKIQITKKIAIPSRVPAALVPTISFVTQTVCSTSTFPNLSNGVRQNGQVGVHTFSVNLVGGGIHTFGVNWVGGEVQKFALCHEGDK